MAERVAAELDALKDELLALEARATAREQQLERFATDLRNGFLREVDAREQGQRALVRALSNAVEARDAYTQRHAERVTEYGMGLAQALGSEIVGDRQVEYGFLLHDVGKVAVPDAILFKPDPLNDAELALMRRHPVAGDGILRDVEGFDRAREVVRHHHERWDGDGYPDRLAREDIPEAARIFAVADALDALTTDRPYRPRSSFAAARAVLRAGSGTQWDPRVVAALEAFDDAALGRLRDDA